MVDIYLTEYDTISSSTRHKNKLANAYMVKETNEFHDIKLIVVL